jgi:hypothetical protein
MTIGELRDELDDWPESFDIIFGCPELEFYRLTKRHLHLLKVTGQKLLYSTELVSGIRERLFSSAQEA